jgi:hypothetical protein
MTETKVKIEKNKWGGHEVTIINDDLTEAEKNKIKYSVYKSINESYHELIKCLSKES